MKSDSILDQHAKQTIIEVGVRLFQEGMVARTWGNVSQRLADKRFAITPSGIPYEKLTVDAIVTVSLEDLSYEGPVKPSSEKGLHAAIYRERPDVRAVIHTHQPLASAFSAARNMELATSAEFVGLIGPHVKTAAYALPGTKKLARAAAGALAKSNAALLANHGAVCVGPDMEEAFHVCLALECLCRNRIDLAVMDTAGVRSYDTDMIHRLYLERFA